MRRPALLLRRGAGRPQRPGQSLEVSSGECGQGTGRSAHDLVGLPGERPTPGRRGHHLDPTVGGMRAPFHKTLTLQLVHHQRGVGGVNAECGGELAHGPGRPGDAAERPDPTEGEAEGVTDLAPTLVVEHQVAHGGPGPPSGFDLRVGTPQLGRRRPRVQSRPGRGPTQLRSPLLRRAGFSLLLPSRHRGCPARNSGFRSRAVLSAVRRAQPVVTS